MLQVIINNAGTIVVSLVMIAIVACIVFSLIRDRKRGKSSCGSGCSCCAMNGSCHKKLDGRRAA